MWGRHREARWEKLEYVLSKNLGLSIIKAIKHALCGKGPRNRSSFPPDFCACFRHAPVTSVKVQRTFSSYKSIFGRQRRQLTTVLMEQLLVSHCNSSVDGLDFLFGGSHGRDPYTTVWMDWKGMDKPCNFYIVFSTNSRIRNFCLHQISRNETTTIASRSGVDN